MNKLYVKGFTILELMVGIIVLAGLATMAIPRYGAIMETFRSKEGQQVLHTVFQGQLLADADLAEGRIANYTLADLDLTLPALDYFNAPVLNFDGVTYTTATVTINSVAYPFHASIQRSTGAYTLYVQGTDGANAKAGRILCDPQAECQPMNICPWRNNC